MSAEFVIAYYSVKDLSPEEAREKLALLKRYFLPVNKEIPKDYFTHLFSSVLSVPPEKLSLVSNPNLIFVHAYNLLLRKARGQKLVREEDEEYAFLKEYEELVKRFPDVDIDAFDGEVLRFFARERKESIETMVEEKVLRKFKERCRGKVYISHQRDGYSVLFCYCGGKNPACSLARGRRERIERLYTLLKPLSLTL